MPVTITQSTEQAIENLNIDHAILLDILYFMIGTEKKNVVLCWIPNHVGIRGNDFAVEISKSALCDQPNNIKGYHTLITEFLSKNLYERNGQF